MSRLPSCTVLLIAYRMQHTIAESLRSVLAQDVPCEIIVSDDCSGDESLSVARDVMQGYSGPHRVTIRSTAQNLGLCAHLNELAGIATGEMLVFQAGDDVARPDRVARLLEEFAAHPQAQVVGSAVDDIDERGRLLAESVRGMPRRLDQRAFLRRGRMQTVLGASMAVRRELITELPPLHGFVEDNMLSLRAALVGECRCLPQALLGYRRHGGNLNDWMFDRSDHDYSTYERRNRRVLTMYRQIAADQERCAEARPDLPAERRRLALALAAMYRLEADMREALLDRPRHQWVRLLWRGLRHPGLHRKSAERGLKLLLPRRWFGRGAQIRGYLGS
ncbi:MAG TPA: glycosyltransferase [Frateuria sp.]|uniref:glycosyltransferase n=1 Tax=Frateuria sp. TaxID=2211372 RepID=UPI002DF2C9FB|nr:glycosyltransferase [Frateuria sp.]